MQEKLYEVISKYLSSCHRAGHLNLESNIEYFLCENDHMKLKEDEVIAIFEEVEYEA